MQGRLFATNNSPLTESIASRGTKACEIWQLLNRINKAGKKAALPDKDRLKRRGHLF